MYNLFHEKFKFSRFTKAFKNFAKYIIFIFAKFKYFAKQMIQMTEQMMKQMIMILTPINSLFDDI